MAKAAVELTAEPVAQDPERIQPLDRAREPLLGRVARGIAVREPVAQAAVQGRRHDQDLGREVAGLAVYELMERITVERLVRDGKDAKAPACCSVAWCHERILCPHSQVLVSRE